MLKYEKYLSLLVAALVVVACILGSVVVALRQPLPQVAASQPGGPPSSAVQPPPGSERGLTIPTDAHGGPYEPWPVSFPKVLPGFFMLEAEAPQLQLTHEQAKQILPLVEEMAEQWAIVHTVEIKIKQQLTPAQKKWISEVKHQVEQTDAIRRLNDALGAIPPGENASVVMTERICQKTMPNPLPPALARACAAERARKLPPRAYMQGPNEEWLTVFDETTAFFVIDQDKPELRLSPEQAAKVHAILQDVKEPLRINEDDFKKICTFLKPEQIQYVQDHMSDLYEYRTGRRKTRNGQVLTFTENPENADASKYHDPLFYQTIVYLQEVARDQ